MHGTLQLIVEYTFTVSITLKVSTYKDRTCIKGKRRRLLDES